MSEIYNNVWDALEDDPSKRGNLKIRSKLLVSISEEIKNTGETQSHIAGVLGIKQPRVSALVTGKISMFSVDYLLDIAYKLGLHVSMQINDEQAMLG
ncbi:hypothetical protein MNBD_GAMMA01-684 [hydrothermal vent metagenome]|uniref:HigA2-like helix-turn-helix domain-containing protein n=1 Tax=hydrothermal vent metagenome TaxID=652676 RepID=A0A3B0VN64_9ZZZZ